MRTKTGAALDSWLFRWVLLDLGFPHEEAAILQLRSEIMADLRKFITTKKLTQAKAAALLDVSQSRVSDLTREK